MKKITLSFAGKQRDDKNTIYPLCGIPSTLNELKQIVRYDHVCGTYKNNHRSREDFMSADCVVFDVDNDNADIVTGNTDESTWLTPEKLSQRLDGVMMYIIFSKSHNRIKKSKDSRKTYSARPRFHCYFPLSEIITDEERIKALKERIMSLCPEFDKGAKDSSRFIFGVDFPEGLMFDGELCIDEFISSMPDGPIIEDFQASEPNNENISDIQSRIQEGGIISQGSRNTTLYTEACRLIRIHGEEDAIPYYNELVVQCEPPLPPNEVNRCWRNAIKFIREQKQKERKAQRESRKAQKEEDRKKRETERQARKAQREEEAEQRDEKIASIRDEYLEKHHIFFHGSVAHGQWYAYDLDGGYWYHMHDSELRSQISSMLDGKSQRLVSQIVTAIQLRSTRSIMPEWNTGQLDNFPNGTLELDSEKFREHRPDDFLTWSHTYDYSPTAIDAPNFDAFMESISAKETSRVDFLSDVMSYVLYHDNRLEKLIFLTGSGSNGKSSFLRLVEMLFESVNQRADMPAVSHVQPADMDKPTERIALEGARLNIAYDIRPNLRGCASALKLLSGNDRLTGNRKFQDTVSFTNRAKIFCSCNYTPQIDDDSLGMRRRLLFCRFTAKFTEDTADTDILRKIQPELPAIYNRLYKGYQALREREKTHGQNAIRPCCDQSYVMREFRTSSNPVLDFWEAQREDLVKGGTFPKTAVYHEFKKFAQENCIDIVKLAITERTFHKRFFELVQDDENVSVSNVAKMRDEDKRLVRAYIFASKTTTNTADLPQTQPTTEIDTVFDALTRGEKITIVN